MKHLLNTKYFILTVLSVSLLLMFSCEDETFNYDTIPTHSDGIQNLDEEGIDCGGSSGVNCPTCSDGILNGLETGIDCGGPDCPDCPAATPRADALRNLGLPYFYTFESGEEQSGENLKPMSTNADGSTYNQGVNPHYGVQDPLGSNDAVTKMIRPQNGPFGGFEDFKFQTLSTPIDFSVYHKWTIEVFIPEDQNFTGGLVPQVDLVFHDYIDGNFWQRWTVISTTIDPSDFGSWVTLYIDGSNATAADTNVLLPQQTTYTNISLVFGGSNHQNQGIFYVKDFIPTTAFNVPGTPRADALANSGLPYYFTFEAGNASSGLNLEPAHTNPNGTPYNQGVTMTYGVADPYGSANKVAKVLRPANGPFGGYEDFKFQFWTQNIDFSVYHKFKLDVYIPSSNNFTGGLVPKIDLILHDNIDGNFWQRWTVISHTIDAADFDKWVTIEYDGTNAAAANNGVLLPAQTTYNNFTLQLGGSGHNKEGTFYIKDFIPMQ